MPRNQRNNIVARSSGSKSNCEQLSMHVSIRKGFLVGWLVPLKKKRKKKSAD